MATTPDTFYICSSNIYGTVAALEAGGIYIETLQSFSASNRVPAHMYPNALPDIEKSQRPIRARYTEMMDRTWRADGNYEFTWVIPFMHFSLIERWQALFVGTTYPYGGAPVSVETLAGELQWQSSVSYQLPWQGFNGIIVPPRYPGKDYKPVRNGWRDATWRFVECISLGVVWHDRL